MKEIARKRVKSMIEPWSSLHKRPIPSDFLAGIGLARATEMGIQPVYECFSTLLEFITIGLGPEYHEGLGSIGRQFRLSC